MAALFYYWYNYCELLWLSITDLSCSLNLHPLIYYRFLNHHLSCRPLRRRRHRGLSSGLKKRHATRYVMVQVGSRRLLPTHLHPAPYLHVHCRNLCNLRSISRAVARRDRIVFGLWNARSLSNKAVTLSDMTISNSLDILIITETWLTEGKDHSLCMHRDLLPDFRLTSIPRASRGGGLAILYRGSFIPKVNSGPVYSSFEYLDLTLSFGKVLCRFISFYRPPPSTRNKSTFNQFFLDFSDLIERIITPQTKIVLAGDFNIHCDLPLDPHSIIFNDTLRTFDLQQHIICPTHCSGHTLDLVITKRVDNDLLLSTSVLSDAPSDHFYIICDLRFPCPRRSKILVSRRNYNAIKMDSFVESLQLADFGSETN